MSKAILASVVIWALIVLGAQAEESKAQGTTSIAAGATVNDGNTDQMVGNASITHERKDAANSLRVGGEINYSELNGDTTNEQWKVFANYAHTLDERWYIFGNATYFHDLTADVDWRWTVAAGPGYYLMKNADVTLGVEVGPGYVWESVAGEEDDYAAIRFAERYDRKLSNTSKCWQSLEYLPRIDDFSDYIATFEIGGEAVLSGPLSIRLVLQDTYDSEPAADKEENDLKVIGALAYTL